MNISQVGSIPLAQHPGSGYAWGSRYVRRLALALVVGAFSFGVGGCVTDGYVGVSAYPSYAPYYGYYGYRGVPYYGYRGIYRRSIVVRGRRHTGSYGRQHFSRYHRGRDRAHFSRSTNPAREPRGRVRGRP